MKEWIRIALLLNCFSLFLAAAEKTSDLLAYWPQWRGPLVNGVAPAGNPPVEWSETRNILWKIAIPGKGHSTPVIWGNQVFIQTAVETEKEAAAPTAKGDAAPLPGRAGMPVHRTSKVHRFILMSIDRREGKILWQHTVREMRPEEGTHEFGSWASSSPVTDGENVYAYFGSRGLFCFDLQGKLKWERDFGQMSIKMDFGEGSSPALYKDKLFITRDQEGPSFIVALDKKTGKDLWKVDRDEKTSWASPYVVESGGTAQVITSATQRVRSYDAETGKLIWECGGMTANVIPMPVEANGILYLMSGFRGNALLAIRLAEARGDITGSAAILWKSSSDTSYTPSPLLYQDRLYFLKANNGILSCLDAKDGKPFYSNQRLEGIANIFASPVAAGGRIYIVGQTGTMVVIKQGSTFEVLAKNSLEDNFIASPAVVGTQLFLRGYKSVYCVQQK
jgi:outer membrane protein assembly factor BamB